jgi:hypothetical protein
MRRQRETSELLIGVKGTKLLSARLWFSGSADSLRRFTSWPRSPRLRRRPSAVWPRPRSAAIWTAGKLERAAHAARWAHAKKRSAMKIRIMVEGGGLASDENLLFPIKHTALREEKIITRIRREIETFENLDKAASARRERIPESVRLFVWQRDAGKCVKCGCPAPPEFDHIIPLALGQRRREA